MPIHDIANLFEDDEPSGKRKAPSADESKYTLAELMLSPSYTSEETPPFIQPEHAPNSELKNYVVGSEQDSYGKFQALPVYRWPRPGQPATEAELDKAAEYRSIRTTAGGHLEEYLWLVAARTQRVAWSNYLLDENSVRVQEITRKLNWLVGIWQGLGVRSPREEKLKEMANSMIDRFEERERARTPKAVSSYWPEVK
jgi:hypothetical protein